MLIRIKMKVDGSSTGSLVLMKYSDQDIGLTSQVYSYRTRVLIKSFVSFISLVYIISKCSFRVLKYKLNELRCMPCYI